MVAALAVLGLTVIAGDQSAAIDPMQLFLVPLGSPAPEFHLPAIGGRTRGLSSADLSEDVSLVNVFASWCVPCREEHPLLMALADQNVAPIYGLNYKDDPESARRWLERLGKSLRGDRIGPRRSGCGRMGSLRLTANVCRRPNGPNRVRPHRRLGPFRCRRDNPASHIEIESRGRGAPRVSAASPGDRPAGTGVLKILGTGRMGVRILERTFRSLLWTRSPARRRLQPTIQPFIEQSGHRHGQ